MKPTSVSVKVKRVYDLGSYEGNFHPEISITADLEKDDDYLTVIDQLFTEAVGYIHQVIDNELELNGKSPVYQVGQLYNLLLHEDMKIALICPADLELPDIWYRATKIEKRRMRYRTINGAAARLHPDWQVFDMSKNVPDLAHTSLDMLPPIRCYLAYRYGPEKLIVLVDQGRTNVDEVEQLRYFGRDDRVYLTHPLVIKWAKDKYEGWQVIDCTDENFEQVPDIDEVQVYWNDKAVVIVPNDAGYVNGVNRQEFRGTPVAIQQNIKKRFASRKVLDFRNGGAWWHPLEVAKPESGIPF